jgi:septum formation protein
MACRQVKNSRRVKPLIHCGALLLPLILLASTSPYRRELLARLRLPFEAHPPGVDEAALAGEVPLDRARRLALAKATVLADRHPDHIVIGADQVAECEGEVLDKPGDAAGARDQLARQSGKTVRFHSAVAVLRRAAGYQDLFVDTTIVELRPLSAAEIEDYVKADQPLDCAGALRSESLGVALCQRIISEDPTGLVGLPLIRLAASLRACGCPLP